MFSKEVKSSESGEIKKEVTKNKKVQRSRIKTVKYKLNREKVRFTVDLSNEKKSLEVVFKLLEQANKKDYGREIDFRDLAIYGINKLGQRDVEKIQEASMSEMEKVERLFNEHKTKHGGDMTLGGFLVKKLNI
ncbi:MAG: hypothetical protein KAQ98_13480 [Bacteriovoracaceae bacterium]|nr:hypothetical protein [Bacteriovoracaceae bacterium]